jgi:hypothetical protein
MVPVTQVEPGKMGVGIKQGDTPVAGAVHGCGSKLLLALLPAQLLAQQGRMIPPPATRATGLVECCCSSDLRGGNEFGIGLHAVFAEV